MLSAAEEAGFEVFITVDKSIPYQQNSGLRRIAIFVLRTHSNRLKDLIPIAPEILALLPYTVPGEVQILPVVVGDRNPEN